MDVRKKLLMSVGMLAVILVLVCIGGYFILHPTPSETPLPNVITAGDGAVTITADIPPETQTPDTAWKDSASWAIGSFTLPEAAALDGEGCIGVVTVPSVGIQMQVYETDDAMEDMKHGAAHFKNTSAWEGNIGLSGHNYRSQFGPLTQIKDGDIIAYETALGTRYYQVSTIEEIADDDWSYLDRTDDNRITLITCIVGKDDKRLVVQGTEI
ncbi:MAG: class D sortase [Ruthenibacterium lactatiformans]|uniref:class D sortase n=1 Tax=Ruthenibacterium lactatiformans TaxID=1550024 RepID=UPI0039927D3F